MTVDCLVLSLLLMVHEDQVSHLHFLLEPGCLGSVHDAHSLAADLKTTIFRIHNGIVKTAVD